MTKQLYLQDSSLTEFDATVTEIIKDENKLNNENSNYLFIVLDQTAFYPEGGGQPSDTGTLTTIEKIYNVLFVGAFNGKISHKVELQIDAHGLSQGLNQGLNHGLKAGDKVHGKIDFERRQLLQRMHTACHVLSSVFVKESGALITGNQLNTEQSRIDFSIETFDREKIQQYIDKANTLLATNQDVETFFLPRHEAEKMPELAKLAMGLKEGIQEVRVVKIGDIDVQADGGTHVKNTREVGKIELVKCENKGKNNRRLYFRL